MLALFNPKVASPPKEITVPNGSDEALKDSRNIMDAFKCQFPAAFSIELGGKCAMAYSHEKEQLLRPRHLAVTDDILCLFVGSLENMSQLRQLYGITKSITEVALIIEIYKSLRDRSPYTADHVIRGLQGSFAFVLFDNTIQSVFVAVDSHGKVPLFWGTTADGSLAFADDKEILKEACGKSFATFPQGCFFSSSTGLQSSEHPLSPLTAMPRVDSLGEVCGSTFKVDPAATAKQQKARTPFPRVGSESGWATAF